MVSLDTSCIDNGMDYLLQYLDGRGMYAKTVKDIATIKAILYKIGSRGNGCHTGPRFCESDIGETDAWVWSFVGRRGMGRRW